MSIVKRLVKIIVWIITILFLGLVLFLIASTILSYKPQREVLFNNDKASITKDTLDIFSWNIGYAGLGANISFFYDGGKKVRDTKENTKSNLNFISSYISEANADITLLQEVDVNSKRSYNTDQVSYIANMLVSYSFFAPNYKVNYVPIPVKEPMGKVESGLLSMSKTIPSKVEHIPYNTKDSWPVGIFSLDRCMLVSTFKCKNNKELLVINTHNSAFDGDGSMRKEEMDILQKYILDEYAKGNYVIVGGDWNQNPPLADSLLNYDLNSGTIHFSPMLINADYMPNDWKWVTDGFPTNRFLDVEYIKGETQETLLDFFLISPNVELLSFSRYNLEYKHSDHNPIRMRVNLKD